MHRLTISRCNAPRNFLARSGQSPCVRMLQALSIYMAVVDDTGLRLAQDDSSLCSMQCVADLCFSQLAMQCNAAIKCLSVCLACTVVCLQCTIIGDVVSRDSRETEQRGGT